VLRLHVANSITLGNPAELKITKLMPIATGAEAFPAEGNRVTRLQADCHLRGRHKHQLHNMGQKIHPVGFRLGITQEHYSRCFARPDRYPEKEDFKLRRYRGKARSVCR